MTPLAYYTPPISAGKCYLSLRILILIMTNFSLSRAVPNISSWYTIMKHLIAISFKTGTMRYIETSYRFFPFTVIGLCIMIQNVHIYRHLFFSFQNLTVTSDAEMQNFFFFYKNKKRKACDYVRIIASYVWIWRSLMPQAHKTRFTNSAVAWQAAPSA